jgi:hypothetical protein
MGEKVSVGFAGGRSNKYIMGELLELQGWCQVGLDGCKRWKIAGNPVPAHNGL